MEYVEVRFSQKRKVYVDGNESGETNKILRIGTGKHAFHLGEPLNYEPQEIIRIIEDTSSLRPEIIIFGEHL